MFTYNKTAFEDDPQDERSIIKVSLSEQYGNSTLGTAILESNNTKYVQKLLNELPSTDIFELSSVTKRTFLHALAEKGDLEMMRLIIKHGIDVNAKDNTGWTALHLSVAGGFQRISKLLIQYGANVNAITSNQAKWHSIHLAASIGHAKLCDILLQNGALGNALTADKWTPLLLASYGGHFYTAKILLKYGANINDTDPIDLETSLHKACRNGHEKVARLLLENGAEITLDKLGISPISHGLACNFKWKIKICWEED
jgi:ankyrin repeat protein